MTDKSKTEEVLYTRKELAEKLGKAVTTITHHYTNTPYFPKGRKIGNARYWSHAEYEQIRDSDLFGLGYQSNRDEALGITRINARTFADDAYDLHISLGQYHVYHVDKPVKTMMQDAKNGRWWHVTYQDDSTATVWHNTLYTVLKSEEVEEYLNNLD